MRQSDGWLEEFLNRHDIVYEKSPAEWENHIPLGNGFTGAALWGDNPFKITLDRYEVWETRSSSRINGDMYNFEALKRLVKEKNKEEVYRIFEAEIESMISPDENHIFPTKLPMGRVELEFGDSIKTYDARLNLYNGIAEGLLTLKKGKIEWKVYVHYGRDIIVIDLLLRDQAALEAFAAKPVQDHSLRKILKGWGYPEPETGNIGEFGFWRQVQPSGGEYSVLWGLKEYPDRDSGDRHITLYVKASSGTQRDQSVRDAYEALKDAIHTDINEIEEEHTRHWNVFWKESFITIPDPRLESLYYAEIYKLGCLSSPNGYPISIQGLWTIDNMLPPWSGDYHFDMNVQECYWSVYSGNRLELAAPLYDMILKNLEKMERDCEAFYGIKGAMLYCAAAYDNTPILGWHTVNLWAGNGPWISHHFWLHYLYSQDREFLKEKAYPVMKKFFAVYEALLEKDEKGIYHLPFSSSPEWMNNFLEAWGRDGSGDLSLIRFLCEALLKAVEILDLKEEREEKWRDILENLAPLPTHSNWLGDGIAVMENMPLSQSHRHHTHLMAIYPLGNLNVEMGEQEKRLIIDSLKQWWHTGKGEWTGWSFPWASAICSRARFGNAAWKYLQDYMDGFIMDNTQHINGDPKHYGISVYDYRPMTVDGGLCVVAAVNEMLLQSWGGIIRVFPSMPDSWYEAEFENLRAEGAFIVSSRIEDGKVKFVKIKSDAGGVCRVRNPFYNGQIKLTEMNSGTVSSASGDEISFDTVKGNTYCLYAEENNCEEWKGFVFEPLRRRDDERNPFGIKIREKW